MSGIVGAGGRDGSMTKSSSGYQSLGNGVYRVNGAVRRSAVTGRFVTTERRADSGRLVSKSAAVRNPRTEVVERAAKRS